MPLPQPVAVQRHPHLAEPLPAGWVRVDLHSHTMWSGDSTTTPDEVEEAVVASGLDVLCITDHNAIRGATELADRLPCRVIVGEELRTHAGEIIGLFLSERIPMGVAPAEGVTALSLSRYAAAKQSWACSLASCCVAIKSEPMPACSLALAIVDALHRGVGRSWRGVLHR
jgi:predicted metal-dependent phosphoesterase TrpH